MFSSRTPHLANASVVTSQLLVGGDLDPDDTVATTQLTELLALGVRHIVDARVEWTDEAFVERLAPFVRYHHVGIDDAGQRIPDSWWDATVPRVQDALRSGDRVLVHCHMGINRGPSLAYATLLAEGWDPVKALATIRAARPIAAVAYAEDALSWHHRRTGVAGVARQDDRERLADWRREHPLDVVRIIRRQRAHDHAAWAAADSSRYRTAG